MTQAQTQKYMPVPNEGMPREQLAKRDMRLRVAEVTKGGMVASSHQKVVDLIEAALANDVLASSQAAAVSYYQSQYAIAYLTGFEPSLEPGVDGHGDIDEEELDKKLQAGNEIHAMTQLVPKELRVSLQTLLVNSNTTLFEIGGEYVLQYISKLMEQSFDTL